MVAPLDRDGSPSGSLMASLSRPTADERTRLAVIADPHLSTRESGTSKLFEHTETHVANAVADIAERDVDATLCVGDITKDGEPWNFDRFDELATGLDAPFYSIPGNHDVPKEGYDHENLPMAEFAERYTPEGEGFPFHVEIGGVDVLGLNTAGTEEWLYDSHEGRVTDEQIDWLEETLPSADAPVVLAHHNLPAMSEQVHEHRDLAEPDMFVPPEMDDPEPFVETLTRHDVPLLLTGHLHMPSAARQGPTRELMMPTTCSFPQGYCLVDVGPEGTEVRFVPVADFDGMVVGHRERSSDSVTARGLTAMAAARLAQFPLVEE
ncbi:metallophosphoesterase [Halobaculum sp. CBA1158]|uniref:metallophosphoesterase family protein n=1 Tax=Halobaculum sp. CBA1158 TaxID=2904243 RepID=UPI001F41B00E|nr:metallophosphoesterase [Halobaculum sp. CBA1158]UIO98872.1 metallophosphoesterase [Halobaculum sp. CBA1158]